MDGLMLDTESVSKKSWAKALKDYGFELPDELFCQVVGRDANADKHYFTQHFGIDLNYDEAQEKMLNYKKAHFKKNGLQMKKGLLHILDMLDKMKIKKCVATSSEWSSMEEKLKSLNLFSRFDGFVTGDQVENGKPDPEIFLKAAKIMETDPTDCIVLEDSRAGVAAAHSAGMRVIMIPDLVQPDSEALLRIYAKCNDLEEAATLIQNMIS